MKRILIVSVLVVGIISSATCFANQANKKVNVTTVKVAVQNLGKPFTFVDENNRITGYDIDVLKKIDRKLPQYTFQYEAMDQTTMLLGVETGKFDIAASGLFKNPDRAVKFLFPEDGYGFSTMKLAVKKSRKDINSLDDLVSRKLVPVPVNWGSYSIIKDYNSKHPEKQIKMEAIDTLTYADAMKWVDSGRYDAFLCTSISFNEIQKQLQLKLKLVGNIQKNPIYFLLNKNQTELKTNIEKVIKELKDNGTLSKLSRKWFNEDVFKTNE